MSYAFPKEAEDGDIVTLENGVAYKYDAAKDRWLVQAVAGSGTGADWGFPLPEDQIEYATLEHSDGRDDNLQIQIDELEQEIDIIAPRLEGAQYRYVSAPTVKPGEMHIASNSFTNSADLIFFNDTALDGTTHAWGSLHEGDYLEITDTQEKVNRTAENYAMYLCTKEPEGTGMKQIEVALVKGQGAPTVGDILDAKGFQLSGGEINDLDDRYVQKNAFSLTKHKMDKKSYYNKDWKTFAMTAGQFDTAFDSGSGWSYNQALIFADLYRLFPPSDWDFVPGYVTGFKADDWYDVGYVTMWQMRMDHCLRFDSTGQVLQGWWTGDSPRNEAGNTYLRFECFRRK